MYARPGGKKCPEHEPGIIPVMFMESQTSVFLVNNERRATAHSAPMLPLFSGRRGTYGVDAVEARQLCSSWRPGEALRGAAVYVLSNPCDGSVDWTCSVVQFISLEFIKRCSGRKQEGLWSPTAGDTSRLLLLLLLLRLGEIGPVDHSSRPE